MPEKTLDNPLKRFDITADQINHVVTVFYAQIRRHPVLGPIFANHIADSGWPEHEDKIARFWRNAILREKNYNGNPMREHLTRPDVKAEHFPLWLALFHQVLHAQLPEHLALSWAAP